MGGNFGCAVVMYSRSVTTLVMLAWSVAIAVADAGHKLSYRVSAPTVDGRVVLLRDGSDDRLVVRQRAAWDKVRPSLERRNANDSILATALPARDILDVVAGSAGAIAALRKNDSIEIVVLHSNLETAAQIVIAVPPSQRNKTVRITSDAGERIFVRIDGDVYFLESYDGRLRALLVEQNVVGMEGVRTKGPWSLALVHTSGPLAYLTVYDTTLRARFAPSMPVADDAQIDVIGDVFVVRSPVDDRRSTIVAVIDPSMTQALFVTAMAAPERVAVTMFDTVLTMASGIADAGRYRIRIETIQPAGPSRFSETPLPFDHGKPVRLRWLDGRCIVLTEGGVVTLDASGTILSADILSVKSDSGSEVSLSPFGDLLVSSSSATLFLRPEWQWWWWAVRFVQDALAWVVPAILVVVLLLVRRHGRRQATILDAMMELPGAGMVLHLDANSRLMRVNDAAAHLLRVTASVPMRRQFRSYATHKDAEHLLDFVQRAHASRTVLTGNVVVGSPVGIREYLFTAVPVRGTLGRFVGTLVTGVDITEELERRRLVNWAQLAHDMQTNLSTIRLNAEQLQGATETDIERKRRIVFQVSVLIQRVRDLVSVGRSDVLDRVPVHSAELCTEIRHEFDPAVFPHVTFQMKLRGTVMLVDRLKISRAIRNAVENGIKALRNSPGVIEIATWFDRSHVYVRVSDTGVGMDSETLANMMKPFFTTAKDGTGTGIGTMIMQHVLHLHGGSLRVMSAPGKGTQVIFRIPLSDAVPSDRTPIGDANR